MLKRALVILGAAGLTTAATLGAPARASTPASGSVTGNGSSVTWTGSLTVQRITPNPGQALGSVGVGGPGYGTTCPVETAPGCDAFRLSVSGGTQHHAVDIAVTNPTGGAGDFVVEVYNPAGAFAGRSQRSGQIEKIRLVDPLPGTYSVRTAAIATPVGATSVHYKGVASMTNLAGVPSLDDPEDDCLEPVPAQLGSPLVDGKGVLELKTHVLLDGVTVAQALAVIDKINADSYGAEQLRIVPTFETVNVPSDGATDVDFWAMDVQDQPTKEGSALIQWTKDHLGGVRPFGADLVYTMTSKEVFGGTAAGSGTPEGDREYGLLGIADCIGGVRYPNHAIAIGEYVEPGFDIFGLEAVYLYKHMSAKVMAHELGHVLGAHHHYGNCNEGAAYVINDLDASPCTLMFPDASALGLEMGTLEASTIRGHANAYTGH